MIWCKKLLKIVATEVPASKRCRNFDEFTEAIQTNAMRPLSTSTNISESIQYNQSTIYISKQ